MRYRGPAGNVRQHDPMPGASYGDSTVEKNLTLTKSQESALLRRRDGKSLRMRRAYERLLELPVAMVVGVMWLVGAALIGSLAMALYWLMSALI
jgi:hypothetical protein